MDSSTSSDRARTQQIIQGSVGRRDWSSVHAAALDALLRVYSETLGPMDTSDLPKWFLIQEQARTFLTFRYATERRLLHVVPQETSNKSYWDRQISSPNFLHQKISQVIGWILMWHPRKDRQSSDPKKIEATPVIIFHELCEWLTSLATRQISSDCSTLNELKKEIKKRIRYLAALAHEDLFPQAWHEFHSVRRDENSFFSILHRVRSSFLEEYLLPLLDELPKGQGSREQFASLVTHAENLRLSLAKLLALFPSDPEYPCAPLSSSEIFLDLQSLRTREPLQSFLSHFWGRELDKIFSLCYSLDPSGCPEYRARSASSDRQLTSSVNAQHAQVAQYDEVDLLFDVEAFKKSASEFPRRSRSFDPYFFSMDQDVLFRSFLFLAQMIVVLSALVPKLRSAHRLAGSFGDFLLYGKLGAYTQKAILGMLDNLALKTREHLVVLMRGLSDYQTAFLATNPSPEKRKNRERAVDHIKQIIASIRTCLENIESTTSEARSKIGLMSDDDYGDQAIKDLEFYTEMTAVFHWFKSAGLQVPNAQELEATYQSFSRPQAIASSSFASSNRLTLGSNTMQRPSEDSDEKENDVQEDYKENDWRVHEVEEDVDEEAGLGVPAASGHPLLPTSSHRNRASHSEVSSSLPEASSFGQQQRVNASSSSSSGTSALAVPAATSAVMRIGPPEKYPQPLMASFKKDVREMLEEALENWYSDTDSFWDSFKRFFRGPGAKHKKMLNDRVSELRALLERTDISDPDLLASVQASAKNFLEMVGQSAAYAEQLSKIVRMTENSTTAAISQDAMYQALSDQLAALNAEVERLKADHPVNASGRANASGRSKESVAAQLERNRSMTQVASSSSTVSSASISVTPASSLTSASSSRSSGRGSLTSASSAAMGGPPVSSSSSSSASAGGAPASPPVSVQLSRISTASSSSSLAPKKNSLTSASSAAMGGPPVSASASSALSSSPAPQLKH